jgi:ribosomal protein L44E
MKKNTKKCPECSKYNSPLISSYYRGKKDRVSVIKRRKKPLYVKRSR